ncbi:MAG TPA: transposase [Herpetosiphonaceae bacterium]|nr:transposase [Herpetosiphonaceae bacterium]
MSWVGYKVHLTETCDPELPRLITHVETTPATTPDIVMIPTIHAALAEKDLLPEEHLVDSGYIVAEDVVTSRETYGIELVGPIHGEPSWQARAGNGFDIAAFRIDWSAQQATCPQGHTSKKWQPKVDPEGHPLIHIRFGAADCRACPVRSKCTKAKVDPRGLTVSPQAQHEVLQAGRQQQRTPAFKAQYAARAGVEGTISQGLRRCDLRQARYIGEAKVHLQHVLTAAALNMVRVGEWLAETPLAKTRVSPFSRLKAVAA